MARVRDLTVAPKRTLFVLRHAKSSWDGPQPDHARGLAPRGVRALEAIASHVERAGVRPDIVLCSTARRACATVAPLVGALGDPPVHFEDALYGASAGELVERLRRVDDAVQSAMVVGHNPGLHDLVVHLASTGPFLGTVRSKFPTGAFATITLDDRPWAALGPGQGSLTDYVRPRDLLPS